MSLDQQPGNGEDEPTPSGVATETPPAPAGGNGEVAPQDGEVGEPAAPVAQEPVAPQIPAEPTPEDVQRALQTPQGQQYLLESYRALTAQVKSEAEARAEQAELEGLIAKAEESGDYADIGKKLTTRHREAARTTEARASVQGEVVAAFSNTVLPALMNDPEVREVLSKMTPEEKKAIDPNNPRFNAPDDFQWYAGYLPVFRSVIQNKAVELAVDAKAEAKFEALKQARANELTGQNAATGTPNLPAATPGSTPQGTASQLLAKGFEEDRLVTTQAADED